MSLPIFTDWTADHTARWTSAPLRLSHRLSQHPLYSLDALAALIEGYPRQHYALVEMGPQGSDRRLWREGEIGGLTGSQVIEAIRRGAHVAQPAQRLAGRPALQGRAGRDLHGGERTRAGLRDL